MQIQSHNTADVDQQLVIAGSLPHNPPPHTPAPPVLIDSPDAYKSSP